MSAPFPNFAGFAETRGRSVATNSEPDRQDTLCQPYPGPVRLHITVPSGVTKGPAASLGARLRHARLMAGLSLKQVAELADVSQGFVSKLENDRARPSLATLHRLATSLQTNIGSLVSGIESEGENVTIVSPDQRPVFEFTDGRGGKNISLEKLIPSRPDNLLQVNMHVVAPGGRSEELISHKGQEFGYVIQGTLMLIVGDETYRIKEGDAFFFNSDIPHGYRNDSDQTARVVWVNSPPTF